MTAVDPHAESAEDRRFDPVAIAAGETPNVLPETGPRLTWGKALGSVALTLAAYLLVAWPIREEVPWSAEYGMQAKMEVWQETRDEYDAVFIGPSSIFRSFIPEIIDPIISEGLGREFRSYNLGMGAFFGHEMDYLVRTEVLAERPARLRHVVLQPGNYYSNFRSEHNVFTERTVRWHDLQGTADVLGTLALAEDLYDWEVPWWDRTKLAGTHLQLYFWRLSSYGSGKRILGPAFGYEVEGLEETRALLRDQRGYKALEQETDAESVERGRWFRNNPQAYLDKLAQTRRDFEKDRDLEGHNLDAWLGLLDSLDQAGLVVSTVLPPIINPPGRVAALAEAGHLPRFIDLNGPDQFPQLYLPASVPINPLL